MKITIIIPVYNEFVTIDKIVGKILKLESLNKQIIIVDDFSNDGTVEKLKKLNYDVYGIDPSPFAIKMGGEKN